MAEVGSVVLPGDQVRLMINTEDSTRFVTGPGLRRDSDQVTVSKAGILKHKEPNIYWVDSRQKRYIPTKGENVIGIVTMKAGDVFRVDIGGSEQASLSYLSFEGATKRNRPDVKIGDLVFGRLLVSNKDMEPELVCISSNGRSNGMGVIRDGGFMFTVPLNLIRKLLSSDCNLLKTLGHHLPFEVAIGMNGRVWVKGRSVRETIAISNAISSAEFMDNMQIKMMCNKLVDALTGFT
ncbi:exosome complex component RRP40 [Lingula anatina]|uniref:Exosome complex component RRP40 n=1 Tax=Lingula anatina TaxID=7574 RepID=A0A1S3K1H3_LINAN|nr:exosome complex component RRP40 [Lingula anatina]|eukprot:XP_013416480.1 exosome complex component RRP40 [Lingula anatina]